MTIRHHLIISGTGRAGTTFLMQLFTALGLDTGFKDPAADIHQNCHAGMELDIRDATAPYVIKSPHMSDYLDSVLESGEVVLDHAIIPMRDLFSAAESRRDVQRRTKEAKRATGESCKPQVPGGLSGTTRQEEQEAVLQQRFYQLMYALAKWDVPTTVLYFPRFIREPEYLYAKLGSILKGMSYDEFLSIFRQVAKPELVHEFAPKPQSEIVSENSETRTAFWRRFCFWRKIS